MSRTHIAIFTIPSPVHVNPTLPIVSTMIRRGHRVSYVTSSRYSPELSTLGAEVQLCPRFDAPFGRLDHGPSLPVEQQHARDLLDLADRTLSLVRQFYDRNRPSIIVYDTHSLAGPILAERLQVPAIRVTSHLICDEQALFLDCLNVSPLFRAHGVDRCDPIFSTARGTVYFYLEDLQSGSEPTVHSAHLYAARCAAERSYSERWNADLTRGRDAILISGSTAYIQGSNFYRTCMEALSRLGLRGILAVGGAVDPSSLGLLSPHFEVVRHLPLLALMPHVRLAIAQGGMATTMEALYHGLPQLLLTCGHAQLEMYADNICKHGLGMHLRKAETTIDNIERCLVTLLEDLSIQTQVRGMQTRLKKSPGAEEVVNFVEEFARRDPPTITSPSSIAT